MLPALRLLKYVGLIGGAVLVGNLASAHDFYDEKMLPRARLPSGKVQ